MAKPPPCKRSDVGGERRGGGIDLPNGPNGRPAETIQAFRHRWGSNGTPAHSTAHTHASTHAHTRKRGHTHAHTHTQSRVNSHLSTHAELDYGTSKALRQTHSAELPPLRLSNTAPPLSLDRRAACTVTSQACTFLAPSNHRYMSEQNRSCVLKYTFNNSTIFLVDYFFERKGTTVILNAPRYS